MADVGKWTSKPRPRTFKALAKAIEEAFPTYKVELSEGYASTDFKPKGYRYITRKGKGRTGSHLKVWRPIEQEDVKDGRKEDWLYKGMVKCLDHNNAETYRSGRDVEQWIMEEAARKGLKVPLWGLTDLQVKLLRLAAKPNGGVTTTTKEEAKAVQNLEARGLLWTKVHDWPQPSAMASDDDMRRHLPKPSFDFGLTKAGEHFVEFHLPKTRKQRTA